MTKNAISEKLADTNANPFRVLDDNYLYISHLDEGLRFWKLPLWPESITDTMNSTYNPTTVLGRTAPVQTYSSSGPRTVQIDLKLHRDIMDQVNIGISNSKLGEGEDYVDNLLKALQSIALPKYSMNNKLIEPPIVALRLGQEIAIKGIVNGGIGLTYEKPILSNGKYACVNLSLTITEIDPYDSTQVFQQGGFRTMVKTLADGMGMN